MHYYTNLGSAVGTIGDSFGIVDPISPSCSFVAIVKMAYGFYMCQFHAVILL